MCSEKGGTENHCIAANSPEKLESQGSYGQGKPEKVREFQNFSKVREKSGNFTITQKLEKIFKNQNF